MFALLSQNRGQSILSSTMVNNMLEQVLDLVKHSCIRFLQQAHEMSPYCTLSGFGLKDSPLLYMHTFGPLKKAILEFFLQDG